MAANETPIAPEREEKLEGVALMSGVLAIAVFSWTVLPMLALGAFAAFGVVFGELDLVLAAGGLIKSNALAVSSALGLLSLATAALVYFVASATR